jgi:hypothetical protein
MDFKARVQFDRTGPIVSRLLLALLERGQMVQAIRNLAAHRDEVVIVLARADDGLPRTPRRALAKEARRPTDRRRALVRTP